MSEAPSHSDMPESPSIRTTLAKHWLALLVAVFAAFLRFWGLDNKGFWYDEFCFWDHFSSGQLLTTLQRVPVAHSPGLALLMLPLKKFLPLMDDYSVRVIPASFGVVGVFLIYLLGTRLFCRRTGVLAAFLLAVAPIHYEYSRQLEPYTLLVCNVIAGVYALYMAWTTNRRNWWLASCLFIILTLYSHPFGVFALFLATACFALDRCVFGRSLRGLIPAAAVWVSGVAAYLPWVVYGIWDGRYLSVSRDALKFVAPETLGFVDRSRQITSHIWQGDNWSGTLTLPLAAMVAFMFLAGFASIYRRRLEVTLLLFWALAPIVIHMVCQKWGYPTHGRYLISALPAYVLLLALGVRNVSAILDSRRRWRPVAWLAAAALIGAFTIWDAGVLRCKYSTCPINDFRSLGRVLDRAGGARSVVVCRFASQRALDFVSRYAPSFRGRVYADMSTKPWPDTTGQSEASDSAAMPNETLPAPDSISNATPVPLLQHKKIVWYILVEAIPDDITAWLKAHQDVRSYTVGGGYGDNAAALLLIPDGAFPDAAARDDYVQQAFDQSVALYQPQRCGVWCAQAQYYAVRFGNGCAQERLAYGSAERELGARSKQAPFSSRIRWLHGRTLFLLQRWDEAAREFAAASYLTFGAEHDYMLSEYNGVLVSRADTLDKAGERAEARQAYMQAYHWEGGTNPRLWLRAAYLTKEISGPAAALEEFKAIAAAHPDVESARFEVGRCYEELGMLGEAYQTFSGGANVEWRVRAASVLRRLKGPEPALIEYLRIVADYPTNAAALFETARCHEFLGHDDQAFDLYAKTVEFAPDNGYAWNKVGLHHLAHGAVDDAESALRRAVELLPNNAEVYAGLAAVYAKKNDTELQKATLQRGFEATHSDQLRALLDKL